MRDPHRTRSEPTATRAFGKARAEASRLAHEFRDIVEVVGIGRQNRIEADLSVVLARE